MKIGKERIEAKTTMDFLSPLMVILLYENSAVKSYPDLQIIITAGNHDSVARLEFANIYIVGIVQKG